MISSISSSKKTLTKSLTKSAILSQPFSATLKYLTPYLALPIKTFTDKKISYFVKLEWL